MWQYFAPLPIWQADESIAAPQRARTPDPAGCCPCKTTVFRGPPEGAMIAVVDPRQADAVMVGEGDAPVVAVLQADERVDPCTRSHARSSSRRVPGAGIAG